MPNVKKTDHIFELAKRGAQARLSDLVHEVKMLVGLFPHLKDSIDKDELPIAFLLKKGARAGKSVVAAAGDAPAKKTRNLSSAARRAISNAQKKRWALYRSNAAKKA